MTYNMAKIGRQFRELLSLSEAAELWGIDESTIRKAIAQGRLIDGVDCRKFGKQWVITVHGMRTIFSKSILDNPYEDMIRHEKYHGIEKKS